MTNCSLNKEGLSFPPDKSKEGCEVVEGTRRPSPAGCPVQSVPSGSHGGISVSGRRQVAPTVPLEAAFLLRKDRPSAIRASPCIIVSSSR